MPKPMTESMAPDTEPMTVKPFTAGDWSTHFDAEEVLLRRLFGGLFGVEMGLHPADALPTQRPPRVSGVRRTDIDGDDDDDYTGKGPCFTFLRMKFPNARRKARVKAYVPCPKNAVWMA
jgi:hypothetical protein